MRKLIFLILFVAAVGIPIAATNSGNIRERVGKLFQGGATPTDPASNEARSIIAGWGGQGDIATVVGNDELGMPGAPRKGSVPPPTVAELSQLLRFDVSPDWVRSNWASNSTALGEPDTYALRVPVFTGTAMNDVAGAVTYYFDEQRRVSRIFLNGRTGDPSKLIDLARARFQMQPQRPRTQGEQLFQYRWNDEPVGELAIRPADRFSHEDPYSNYRVELDVFATGQPGNNAPQRSLFGTRPSSLQAR